MSNQRQQPIKVLGMDPSMSNWGISCGVYVDGVITINHVDVIQTQLVKAKGVRPSSLDIKRAAMVLEGILPYVEQADAIFVEVPHGSQSSSAMKSYGMCITALAALRVGGYDFYELNNVQIKAVTGRPPRGEDRAEKKDMIEWATATHPEAPWSLHNGKINSSKVEHQADATAAIHAGIKLPAFQQFLQGVQYASQSA